MESLHIVQYDEQLGSPLTSKSRGGLIDLSNYNHTILKTEYDNNTGVIIDQEKYKKVSKAKGGWTRMYRKDYTETMEQCINGKVDVKAWHIILSRVRSDFTVDINVSRISKEIKASRTTINSLKNRMVENGAIKKINDTYEFNPFIYCPFGASDNVISEKQDEWKQYSKETK